MGKERLKKYWEQLIERCESSNLSKAEYCRQNQLVYHQYLYWQKRIQTAPQAEFLPIRVSQSTQTTGFEQSTLNIDYGIIEYPSGIRLHIQSEVLCHMVPRLVAIK